MYFELVILKCYETDVYLSSVHWGVTGLNFFVLLKFSEGDHARLQHAAAGHRCPPGDAECSDPISSAQQRKHKIT